MSKPSRASNLKAVSKEVQKEIKELQEQINMIQIVFQLLSNGQFPGQQSGNVLAALKWADAMHTPLHARLMKLAPPPPKDTGTLKPVEGNA